MAIASLYLTVVVCAHEAPADPGVIPFARFSEAL